MRKKQVGQRVMSEEEQVSGGKVSRIFDWVSLFQTFSTDWSAFWYHYNFKIYIYLTSFRGQG